MMNPLCCRVVSNFTLNLLNLPSRSSSPLVIGRSVRWFVKGRTKNESLKKDASVDKASDKRPRSSAQSPPPGGVVTVGHAAAAQTTTGRKTIEDLVKPVPVKIASSSDDINVGAELSGSLSKDALMRTLNTFVRQSAVRRLSQESGLNDRLLHQAFISFRRFCLDSSPLPADLHITFADILNGSAHIDDLFPHFLKHARQVFPHLECLDELKTISDLRLPHNWYPEARSTQRRVVFHCGPTNSGKTYQALERFMTSKTAVYCGPLKLLATEVYYKCNNAGVPCDLVTGEERRYANPDKTPCGHVACTVEMLATTEPYDIAVIDEIQMLRDHQRGWAWTRALLGANAQELHLCGEAAAVDVVKEILYPIGEEVDVRHYKRMSPLKVASRALQSFANIRPGDCVVVFNKSDLFNVTKQIENQGSEVAVIYGSLPPGTKLAQAQKFNDPNNPCKVLVATDAIGMGLNLNIARVIFYSLTKPTTNDAGELEMELISTSQCLQIGGRAGRFGTEHQHGEVTTLRTEDLPVLQQIMARDVETITQAGLNATIEQIEMFAYYLPKATLSNLIDIFVSICAVDESKFFMCHVEDFKFLADMIEHVPLPLKVRYTFCLAPVNRKLPFVCTVFLRFARKFSRGELLTWEWLCSLIGWPFSPPQKILDLVHLEGVFDVMDAYLWLGYRFADMFPDMDIVREMQQELDIIIREGVANITRLLKNTDTGSIATLDSDYDAFHRKSHRRDHAGDGVVPALSRTTDQLSQRPVRKSAGHSISQSLVDRGLLTPEMLKQLKKELLESETSASASASGKTDGRKR